MPQVSSSGRGIWEATTAESRGLVLLERCFDVTGNLSVFADILSLCLNPVSSWLPLVSVSIGLSRRATKKISEKENWDIWHQLPRLR